MIKKITSCFIVAFLCYTIPVLLAEEKEEDTAKTENTDKEKEEKSKNDDKKTEEKKEPSANSSTLAEGESPQWPLTVQLDKASNIIEGGHTELKKELFEKAKKLTEEAEEILTKLDEIRKKSFDEYLKIRKQALDFSFNTKIALGKLKTPDTIGN